MEETKRRITVRAEGTSNVLEVVLQPGEQVLPYCCKIMESCNIPGLLPMRHQMVDGELCLRYSIGGKMPLHEFMRQHRLTYQNGVMLLRNLSDALLHLNEYFLSIEMCELDPEYLYVGDGLRVYLPCIPVQRESGQSCAARLKTFYEHLLSDSFATADCSSYDAMFKWVYKATLFDLQTFRDQFLKETAVPPAPAAQPAPKPAPRPAAPAPKPQPQPEKPAEENNHLLTELLQSKEAGVKALYSESVVQDKGMFETMRKHTAAKEAPAPQPEEKSGGLGFAIPGMDKAKKSAKPAEPAPEKKAAPAKEKKSFWPFGGSDKETPAQPEETPHFEAPQPPKKPKGFGKRAHAQEAPRPQQDDSWDSGTILVDEVDKREEPLPETPQTPRDGSAYLVHKGKKVAMTNFPFKMGKANTTTTLDYSIYDNSKVSRSHATILKKDGVHFLRDNQSRNGTFLNGQALLPLQPVPLKDGDEIRLYDEVLIFHLG